MESADRSMAASRSSQATGDSSPVGSVTPETPNFHVSSKQAGDGDSWRFSLRQLGVVFLAGFAIVAAIILIERQSAPNNLFEPIPGGAANSRPLQVGLPAPDFGLPDLAGNPVRLSDFQGKTVVMNFWATWCPPCRAEMPELDEVAREYRDKGVVVLAINLQEDPAQVGSYLHTLGVEFSPLLDLTGDIFRLYRITGLPMTYIIGPDGMIQDIHVGALNKRTLVAKLEAVQ
jgi:thiol-disulfide isomerase/thioredoxin